ncbi:hypothetical protein BJY52DRAFT_1335551, partial [Lactarius psammicola]
TCACPSDWRTAARLTAVLISLTIKYARQRRIMTFVGNDSGALGPLSSGREIRLTSTRRIYFVDHNTRTTTWDDLRLPSTVEADNASQY